MRLRAILFATVALGATGYAAWRLAETATAALERQSRADLSQALAQAGDGWVRLDTDGLTVTLTGEAPDEAARLQAVRIARQVVGRGRVADRTTLGPTKPASGPAFALEVLRNGAEVSLIGLVPSEEAARRSRPGSPAPGSAATG